MSDILFLGTGAADWKIENRESFFRRNTSALINRELMIDCSEHIFNFKETYGDDRIYDKVTDIIITHNHEDHFSKESLLKLAQTNKLRVGCHKEIKNIIGNHPNIEFVLFTPFKTEKMGEYEIIPLLANHMDIMNENSCSFHYIIKTFDSKTVFYGLDGAWFLRPSWEIMKKQKFDIMVMDCTVGDMNDWRFCEHNTIPMLRIMADGIRTSGMLLESGKIVASHFARTLHVSHEDTREVLEQMDVITAYDAMTLEF